MDEIFGLYHKELMKQFDAFGPGFLPYAEYALLTMQHPDDEEIERLRAHMRVHQLIHDCLMGEIVRIEQSAMQKQPVIG